MLLKQAIAIDPENFSALNQYGILAMRFGKMQIAIDSFIKIIETTKDDQTRGNALGNLGSAYLNLGKVEKAIKYYNKTFNSMFSNSFNRSKAFASVKFK